MANSVARLLPGLWVEEAGVPPPVAAAGATGLAYPEVGALIVEVGTRAGAVVAADARAGAGPEAETAVGRAATEAVPFTIVETILVLFRLEIRLLLLLRG